MSWNFLSNLSYLFFNFLCFNLDKINLVDNSNKKVLWGKKLFNRNEAIKRLKNERGLLKDKDTTVLDMQQTISAIGIGLSEGKADILYTKLLQKSLRELEEAEKYYKKAIEFNKENYKKIYNLFYLVLF